jgi:hypothetical protein
MLLLLFPDGLAPLFKWPNQRQLEQIRGQNRFGRDSSKRSGETVAINFGTKAA